MFIAEASLGLIFLALDLMGNITLVHLLQSSKALL
jgi:hypothetical protein